MSEANLTQTQNTGKSLSDWMRQMSEDMLWCFQQTAIMDEHPGEVVVVFNRNIMGWGPGSVEALEDAKQRAVQRNEVLPEPHQLLFIPVPDLRGCQMPLLPGHPDYIPR